MIEPNNKRKIFVYGSLRTGFFNYDKYLKGNVISSKPARVKGKLYHMPNKGYPALIEGNDYVYGEVVTLKNYEEVMVAMDKMENYYGPNNSKNEYNRIEVDVELLGKTEPEKCYIYQYALDNDKDFNKKSIYIDNGDWKSFILKKTS